MHYPSDPFQPGPVYFLTPRKCAIFGVCCEAVPRQVRAILYTVHCVICMYGMNVLVCSAVMCLSVSLKMPNA